MEFFKDNFIELKTNERLEQIEWIEDAMSEIEDNILDLKNVYNNLNKILADTQKNILEMNASNDNLNIEINIIQNLIKNILLNNELKGDWNLQNRINEINNKKHKIETNSKTAEHLQSKSKIILQEITNVNDQINYFMDQNQTLLYTHQLSTLKENSSDIKLNDLTIKPDWLEEFVNSYNDKKIPKELLEKTIFLKWENNSGKHSVIKAIWNELNRPIFKVKYDDYMDDAWLYGIFITLISYLRNIRKTKNENISYYNTILEKIERLNSQKVKKNTNIIIEDIDWNMQELDIGTKDWKELWLTILKNSASIIKEEINKMQDSCILYVDDLDRIIQSSSYEKWNLLWPIKMIIDDIKNENHDVLLILVGNNLGNNHHDFKFWIDRVFQFEWIENDYKDVFDKITSKYLKKLDIKNNIGEFDLNNLPREYRNIKFLDKLAKKIIKISLNNWEKISQEIFDKELNKLITSEKSLYTSVWLK